MRQYIFQGKYTSKIGAADLPPIENLKKDRKGRHGYDRPLYTGKICGVRVAAREYTGRRNKSLGWTGSFSVRGEWMVLYRQCLNDPKDRRPLTLPSRVDAMYAAYFAVAQEEADKGRSRFIVELF